MLVISVFDTLKTHISPLQVDVEHRWYTSSHEVRQAEDAFRGMVVAAEQFNLINSLIKLNHKFYELNTLLLYF